MQVAKISNVPNWDFERVVFPGQRLLFEASIEAVMKFILVRIKLLCFHGFFVKACKLTVAIAY
ncbi:MAG: DUF1830 domain-containing protein [Hassallia sp.]